MGIWYAAVADDPLTSGPGGRVYAKGKAGTVRGEDGRSRRLAFIGDEAYCAACGTTGVIAYGADLREQRRLLDFTLGKRRQAVGGDIVLCKCASPPRIIALYGRKWTIRDQGESAPARAAPSVAPITYDEQFILYDGETQRPLRNVRYRIFDSSGLLAESVTDENGCTRRISTSTGEQLRLFIKAGSDHG